MATPDPHTPAPRTDPSADDPDVTGAAHPAGREAEGSAADDSQQVQGGPGGQNPPTTARAASERRDHDRDRPEAGLGGGGGGVWAAGRRRFIRRVVRQFGQPRGLGGRLAGWVMGHRASNRDRNRWVAGLLAVQPGDRVLEVGFGPGIAVAELSRQVGPAGQVDGLDHSAVMVRQATRRNARAVAAGQVVLARGSVDRFPDGLDGPYDAVLAVNSLGFWPSPADRLADLRRRLAPGGRIAIASQPRTPGADRATALDAAAAITDLLLAAGFADPRTEVLDLDPPVACVLAGNAAPDSGGADQL